MKKILRELRQNKTCLVGVLILLFFGLMAVFAPVLAPYDPEELLGAPYLKPSAQHLLGTNDIGQDIFSELIYGARVSLSVGILSAAVVTVVGSVIGIVSGYYKGAVDKVFTVLTNLAMTIPSLPLTILLVGFLKTGMLGMVVAICITSWASTARVVRSKVLQIRELPYIKIEKMLGAPDILIMFKHILPNITDIVLTRCAMSVGGAMMTESSLSFLGLGSFTRKSWGNILHFAFFRSSVLNNQWWWYLPPILCISLCMLGFMLITYHGRTRSQLIQA